MVIDVALFSRLKALFPTAGFPQENYLTEIVAAAVERQPAAFLAWLREIGATALNGSASISVGTQHYCQRDDEQQTPEKYPDFFIRVHAGTGKNSFLSNRRWEAA